MRVISVFILSVFSNCVLGQTTQDTITVLENKATHYLSEMYTNQNFDSALNTWHVTVLSEIKEIYAEQNKHFSDETELLKNIKLDYKRFYVTNTKFLLLRFEDRTLSYEGKAPAVFFKYSYSELINEQYKQGSTFLYYLYDKEQAEWKVSDFRIIEILGDSSRWLK